MKRPTIIDVAVEAGVSKSTAARAMSGAKNVSPKMRDAVTRAARDIGYQRNNIAVSMRSGRSGLLGIVVPDISNPFWAEVVRGAQDVAGSLDSSLLIFSSDWDLSKEKRHVDALLQARVDGFLLNSVANSQEGGFLEQPTVPFVLLGTSADLFPDVSSVGSNIGNAVEIGLNYLKRMGHGVPALIVSSERKLARAKFVSAVQEYLIAQDFDPARLRIEECTPTADGGRSAMDRLLDDRTPEHLTVFAANDLMALGAIMCARERGVDCPSQVSVLGIDGIPAGEFCAPPLTTVAKPARSIGAEALSLLGRSVAGGSEAISRLRLDCELVERGSVGRLNLLRKAS